MRARVAGVAAGILLALALPVGPAAGQGASSRGSSAMAQASSVSGYRSTMGSYSDLRSSASSMTWSQPRPSEFRESASRDSARRPSELRAAETRASEVRASEPRWSQPRWSEFRESAGSVSSTASVPVAASDARGSLVRPQDAVAETATPADLSAWSPDALESGDVLPSLPPVYMTVTLAGRTYYVFDDVFYEPAPPDEGTGYKVVPPPVGATLNRPPPGAEPVQVGNATYYKRGDLYVQATTAGYIVVAPPP